MRQICGDCGLEQWPWDSKANNHTAWCRNAPKPAKTRKPKKEKQDEYSSDNKSVDSDDK